MHKKLLIVFLIAAVFAAAGFILYKQQERKVYMPEIGSTPEFLSSVGLSSDKYVSSRAGFSMHPPTAWQIDESGQLGTFVVFVEPNGDEESGTTFSANINVIGEQKPADLFAE